MRERRKRPFFHASIFYTFFPLKSVGCADIRLMAQKNKSHFSHADFFFFIDIYYKMLYISSGFQRMKAMANDLDYLYAAQEKCAELTAYLNDVQISLKKADLSGFADAFACVCADELLPVIREAEERCDESYEEYARRLRREYRASVL